MMLAPSAPLLSKEDDIVRTTRNDDDPIVVILDTIGEPIDKPGNWSKHGIASHE